MERTHIVCWSTGESINDDNLVDHWEAFDDKADAEKRYYTLLKQMVQKEKIQTVSICQVLDSTDY